MEPRTQPPTSVGSYPVRLDGEIDPAVSRWLWLVKWHSRRSRTLIVLALLWLADVVLTVRRRASRSCSPAATREPSSTSTSA